MSDTKITLYYADWCGHCTSFKPTWQALKKVFKDNKVKFAEYEADKDKEVVDEVGYICEDYFMYYEDVDWSIKAFRKGIQLKIVNDSVVRHYKNKYVPLKLRFYSFKNRLLFIYKNYPLFFPIQIILIPIVLFFCDRFYLLLSCLYLIRFTCQIISSHFHGFFFIDNFMWYIINIYVFNIRACSNLHCYVFR